MPVGVAQGVSPIHRLTIPLGSTDVDSAHDIADAGLPVGRSVPSVVTDRPPARYGFAWATENGRLYEFGGVDAATEGAVSDLYMYHQVRRQANAHPIGPLPLRPWWPC